MNIKRIVLTKSGTLNVSYSNEDGDAIAVNGANIVHQDMRAAMARLMPHLVMLTEQVESQCEDLEKLRNDDDLHRRMSVLSLDIKGGEVSISGMRVTSRGEIVKVSTAKVDLEQTEYPWADELGLDVDNARYEAELYITERKWGLKQMTIDFDNPFDGVEAVSVASVEIQTAEESTTAQKSKETATA